MSIQLKRPSPNHNSKLEKLIYRLESLIDRIETLLKAYLS